MASFSPTTFTFGADIGKALQAKKARELTQAAQFQKQLEQGRTDTEARLKDIAELAAKVKAKGGDTSPFREISRNVAESYAGRLAQLSGMAAMNGQDSSALPSGEEFISNALDLFDAAVGLGGLDAPDLVGQREAAEALATGRGIKGGGAGDTPIDLTAEERARVGGFAESGTVINFPGERESSFQKALGSGDADAFNDIRDNAAKAGGTLRDIAVIQVALESKRFETGILADARQLLGRFLQFTGIDIGSEEIQAMIGDPATADTLDSAANRLGIEVAQKMSRVTNFSLQFIKDSLPALTRTPEGNAIIAEIMEEIAQNEIEEARRAENFLSRHGTLRPSPQELPDGTLVHKRSFFQEEFDFYDENPLISDELKRRITRGTKTAPKSFADFTNPFTRDLFSGSEAGPHVIPDELEEGTTFVGTKEDENGQKYNIYELPNGQQVGRLIDE